MNIFVRFRILAAYCSLVSGATVALAALFHAAAAAILRGAQSLHLADLPVVSKLALTFLNLRAQAFTAGAVFLAITVLLVVVAVIRPRQQEGAY